MAFQTVKVTILPANEVKGDFSKERIYPCLLKYSWMFDEEETGKLIYSDSNIRTPTQLQHLYIISDDEIKEGDWFIDLKDNTIWQNKAKENMRKSIFPECKKIISTTDSSLSQTSRAEIPQPSDSFIKKYIEEYNKGNIITDVLVEYNCGDSHCSLFGCQKYLGCKNESIQTVKINPKDNTITIKKVKDSWNREEILNDIEQAIIQGLDIGQYRDKWIKENL